MRSMVCFVMVLGILPAAGVAGQRKPLLPGPPEHYDLFRPAPQVEVRPSGRQDGGLEIYRGQEHQGRLVPDGLGGFRMERDLGRPTYEQVPGITAPKR